MRQIFLLAGLALAAVSCSANHGPESGSQTHFLRRCNSSCAAPYACLCGVCSLACDDNATCGKQNSAAVCLTPQAESCDDVARACDLECRRDGDCAHLGDGYSCETGRCRGPMLSEVKDAGSGGSAGEALATAGRGAAGRAGSTAAGAGGGPGSAGAGGNGSAGAGSDESLCDGSSDIRLLLQVGGGFVQPSYNFTNVYGHRFMLVDGKCHYYASTNFMLGITAGDLTGAEASQLQSDIGWSNRRALAGESPAQCTDGGTTLVATPDAAFSCSCGECGAGAAAKTQAIRQAAMLIESYAQRGTPLTGPVSAMAYDVDYTGGAKTPRAWPLSRSIVSISGLIVDTNSSPSVAASFDAAADVMALRMLRQMQLSTSPDSTFITVTDGKVYTLFVRDDLPSAIHDARRAFVERANAGL